jgi:hypothetical protein
VAQTTVHPVCRAQGIPLIGGGGTDLRAGFAAALRRRPAPDAVVALTDGQTPWPSAKPPCRTVVGLFPREPKAPATVRSPPPGPAWSAWVAAEPVGVPVRADPGPERPGPPPGKVRRPARRRTATRGLPSEP